jgi:uncharacterized protein (DUF342 family)
MSININIGVDSEIFDRMDCLKKLIVNCEDPIELNKLHKIVRMLDRTKIVTIKEIREFRKMKDDFRDITNKIGNCMAKKMKKRNKRLW